jgi:phenylalanyl-tRNA synthetase beta chain
MLETLPSPKTKAGKTRPKLELSEFQAVERDFAFVVEAKVSAADVLKAVQGADRVLIESTSIFDLYEGKGIEPGMKSLAVAVRLQPRSKTLTDSEIEAVSSKIVAAVTKATGAKLRT